MEHVMTGSPDSGGPMRASKAAISSAGWAETTQIGQIDRYSSLRYSAATLRYGIFALRTAASNAAAIWCIDDPLPSLAEFVLGVRRLWRERRAVIGYGGNADGGEPGLPPEPVWSKRR